MNESEKEKLLQKCQDMGIRQKQIFSNTNNIMYKKAQAAMKCFVCLEIMNVLEGKKSLEQAFDDLMER